MSRLEAVTGRDFDLSFTEIIARHHAGAITMSKDHLPKTENAGLREIARSIIENQTADRRKQLAMHEQLEDEAPTAMTSSSAGRERMTKD